MCNVLSGMFNFLIIGAGDCRHILKTIAHAHRHTKRDLNVSLLSTVLSMNVLKYKFHQINGWREERKEGGREGKWKAGGRREGRREGGRGGGGEGKEGEKEGSRGREVRWNVTFFTLLG